MAITQRDIRGLIGPDPMELDAVVRYRMRWQGGWYAGSTEREYGSHLGAREIARLIKLERDDRRAVSGSRSILDESVTLAGSD